MSLNVSRMSDRLLLTSRPLVWLAAQPVSGNELAAAERSLSGGSAEGVKGRAQPRLILHGVIGRGPCVYNVQDSGYTSATA